MFLVIYLIGQQLVKQPDGKLQLISNKSAAVTTTTTSQPQTPVVAPKPAPPPTPQTSLQQALLQSGSQSAGIRLMGQSAASGQSAGVQVVRTAQGMVVQQKPAVPQVSRTLELNRWV